METTIAAYLLALSRELRRLERLFRQVALLSALNGDKGGRLPPGLTRDLAHLACRADELAPPPPQFSDGVQDPVPRVPIQARNSSDLN